MSKPDLERTAYTIECFFNALGIADGPERIADEEWIVRWLASIIRRQNDCIVYSQLVIDCYSGGKVVKSYAVPETTLGATIWSDGERLSKIDGEVFFKTGKLVMLGLDGLSLDLPGGTAAAP